MNCARHPARQAVGQCSQCGAYVCDECMQATKPLQEEEGTLCVDCYQRKLRSAAEYFRVKRKKRRKKVIISVIMYLIGIIVLAIGFTSEGTKLVTCVILGIILCGIYTAIAGWRTGREAYEDYELKHGASYTVTDSGVYRNTGFFGKLLMFLLGAVLGVIVTPISVITNIVGMSSDKKTAAEFEQEANSVSKI